MNPSSDFGRVREQLPSGLNKIFGLVAVVVVLIILTFSIGNITENLDAGDQMVIQYPNGVMETFFTPGWKPQWFGRVTKYNKRGQLDFMLPERGHEKDPGADHSIEVRFNDGGHGNLGGTIAYEMPSDRQRFLRLHMLYNSQEGMEKALIGPSVYKAVYMTGPLMSSTESYASRRNELLSLIEDQVQHGVYRTRKIEIKQPDPITGQEKTVSVVQLVTDDKGIMARQERSPLEEFGIRAFNLAIKNIRYSDKVEGQIQQQQDMTMAVQTAVAEARKAEQNAITAEQNGKAQAAKAKWDQEVIKAKEVTAAESRLAVATLEAQAAEQTKRKLILEGEGEGGKRRAIMIADGALQQKLAAWGEAQKVWATAFQNFQGQLVPSVVWGGNGSAAPASGAQDFMNIMGMRAARDLGLDMSMPRGATTGNAQPGK